MMGGEQAVSVLSLLKREVIEAKSGSWSVRADAPIEHIGKPTVAMFGSRQSPINCLRWHRAHAVRPKGCFRRWQVSTR
ncbi:MAG TPA: hypothetical protein DDW73_03160 [Rhizobium sp.]|nr:hypothetical protein [Rhizobium sp.]